MNKGILYLIPSLLADGPPEAVLPGATLEVIRRLDYFIVEEIRTARRFLIRAGITKTIDELTFLVFNEHTPDAGLHEFLECTESGHDIGLLSEAGAPCVADPGSQIVAAAHLAKIRVVPLTGPSSLLLALMASGFNGQNFCFHGYLPADKAQRTVKIRGLEKAIHDLDQTQIFIETPYRNRQLFEALTATCREHTMLCIAVDVTGANERIESKSIGDWRGSSPDIHKKPAIFLLYH
jgi:16S rRNA (cytidine1402-2'-O)-methyltransferase